MKKLFIIPLILLILACEKQDDYGLEIIDDKAEYQKQVNAEPDMKMIDLEKYIPNLILDIRYATKNNFTGEIIYPEVGAYARKPVAESLKLVQDSLNKLGLSLKVFDAYRPYAATVKFYEVYDDTNYVANPKYGSRHNRGAAVDVTLVNLRTGKQLEMPTEFDDFTEKAHPDYMKLSENKVENRKLLIDIMSHFGFTVYPTEWWHYDYNGWEKYPLMNLKFSELD